MKHIIGRKDGKIIVTGGGSKEEQINLLKPNEMLYGSDIEAAPKKIFIDPNDLFLCIVPKGSANTEYWLYGSRFSRGTYTFEWAEGYNKNVYTSEGGYSPSAGLVYKIKPSIYGIPGFIVNIKASAESDEVSLTFRNGFEMLLYIGCPYYSTSNTGSTVARASGAKYWGNAPDNKDLSSVTTKYKYGGIISELDNITKLYKGPYDFTVNNGGGIPLILGADAANKVGVSLTVPKDLSTITETSTKTINKDSTEGAYTLVRGDYNWVYEEDNITNGTPVITKSNVIKGLLNIDKNYIVCRTNCEVLFPAFTIKFVYE